MDTQTIARLAKEADGFADASIGKRNQDWQEIRDVVFARAVAEACANVCDTLSSDDCCVDVRHAAAAIRAL